MAGFLQPTSMLTKIMRWANKVMFEGLDAVVTIGRDMNTMLMAYPKMTAEKITFIPNWATLPVRYRQIAADNPFAAAAEANSWWRCREMPDLRTIPNPSSKPREC